MTNLFNAIWTALRSIDLRSWAAIGIFALTWRIIEIVAANTSLLQDSSFMQLVTPIAGAGGLLLIIAFLFASNKEGADKSAALKDNAQVMREAGIPVGGGRRQNDTPEPQPLPVIAVSATYANQTDDELRAELIRRLEDPVVVSQMDRNSLLTRLTEMDAAIPQEPKA